MNQSDAYLKRIDALLATDTSTGYANIVAAHTGAVTLATAIYGVGRPQVQLLLDAIKKANSEKTFIHINYVRIVWPVVQGSLQAMKGDIEAGVISSIERRGSGAVLADMLGLAKDALDERTDGAKNVAAVLAAASFEDTIRKMGETLAGVTGRPDLQDVVAELKKAGVLQGASVATAVGFLKFRNDALHADWAKLKPDVVSSCISFVEQLLWQHFS
jgi:hypothetical protein